jgi:hypothetical protein
MSLQFAKMRFRPRNLFTLCFLGHPRSLSSCWFDILTLAMPGDTSSVCSV